MIPDKSIVEQRLPIWIHVMEKFDLPDWDTLPQLDLYMDQVIILLTQYFSPLIASVDDKVITASIINNYVRMKVMPPPVKKKYGRIHIAYLIMICILKQSLSISCIQRMLPEIQDEASIEGLYKDFVQQYRTVSQIFIQQLQTGTFSLFPDSQHSPINTAAIISTLAKGLTEFLVQPPGDETE